MDRLLITANSEMEADMIMEELKSMSIPAYKKSDGSGEYLNIIHGASFQGIGIYVLEMDYEKAKKIIASYATDPEDQEDTAWFVSERKRLKRRKRIFLYVILLIFILPALLAYIFALPRAF